MSTTVTDHRRCTRQRCLERDRRLQQVRIVLGPALTAQPSDDPVDALVSVVQKSVLLLKERNAYRGALQRVHRLWADAQTRAGIVLADDLASAIYIAEEGRR